MGVQGLLSKLSTTHPDSLHGKKNNDYYAIGLVCFPKQLTPAAHLVSAKCSTWDSIKKYLCIDL